MITRILATCLFSTLYLSVQAIESPFATTRLKSTAGTGVASVLMDETTFLNPAPLIFFQNGSMYFSKSDATPVESDPGVTSEEIDNMVVAVSDSKGRLKGSVSYLKERNGRRKRNRWGVALAQPIGKSSALGFSYSRTKVENVIGEDFNEDKYGQSLIGVLHVLNPSWTLGLVVNDPLGGNKDDTRAIVGTQYVYESFFSLMADIGADWNEEFGDSTIYRGAMQLKIFSDFYLRFGMYQDDKLKQSGNGVGIGWVQPRMTVELALNNITQDSDTERKTAFEKYRETSFSLSYRF